MADQVSVFQRNEIPRDLAVQIRSFVRSQWPFLTGERYELWDATVPSTHFCITRGELLAAHASVRLRDVPHAGTTYAVAGLSTVFTYPDFRGQRLAESVTLAATDSIRSTTADLALLFCGGRVSSLYLRSGWHALPDAHITYGTPPRRKEDNLVMAIVLTAKGQSLHRDMSEGAVHVGESTW